MKGRQTYYWTERQTV